MWNSDTIWWSFSTNRHERWTILTMLFENCEKSQKFATKICWNIEVWAVQKHVTLVDLVKSFPTNIYYFNLVEKIGIDTAENEPSPDPSFAPLARLNSRGRGSEPAHIEGVSLGGAREISGGSNQARQTIPYCSKLRYHILD